MVCRSGLLIISSHQNLVCGSVCGGYTNVQVFKMWKGSTGSILIPRLYRAPYKAGCFSITVPLRQDISSLMPLNYVHERQMVFGVCGGLGLQRLLFDPHESGHDSPSYLTPMFKWLIKV